MNAIAHLREQFDDPEQQLDAAKLGMWVFLATEMLLFGALFCVYFFYRYRFTPGFAAASRHTDFWLGTLETCVLLTSSLSMALALRALRMAQRRAALWLVLGTALGGLLFLGIHGYEYWREWHEHLLPGRSFDAGLSSLAGAQLFFLLYYVMTGLHALHVCIGVGVLLALAALIARGRFSSAYHTPVELGGLYWHLVDVVWIFLYPLFYLVARS